MSKQIRILHIGYSTNPGGIENLIYSWVKNLPEDIHFDFVNCEEEELTFENELKKHGCNVYKIAHKFKDPIQHFKDLRKIIKEGNYDYIHHHVMVLVESDPYILAKHYKTKIISHCHSNNLEVAFGERVLNMLAKVTMIGCNYLPVSCSQEGGITMFKSKPFTVIENGIDINRFKYSNKSRRMIRKKYNLEDDNIVVGHVGRETIDKNYPFIISTFKELYKNDNKYRLMLVGDINCLSNDVIDLIKEYKLENATICTGTVNDTSPFYSAMDVFFFPSLKEGLGIALIEAQASGLPCVASINIPKDANVSKYCEFVDYDVNLASSKINEFSKTKIDRKKAEINQRYNIVNSSAKLFDYYRNNL